MLGGRKKLQGSTAEGIRKLCGKHSIFFFSLRFSEALQRALLCWSWPSATDQDHYVEFSHVEQCELHSATSACHQLFYYSAKW